MQVDDNQIVIKANSVQDAIDWINENDPSYFGRYKGTAYLVIQNRLRPAWEYRINNQEPIMSCLMNHDVLAFHLLSEINSGCVTELEHAFKWYHRSLASTQSIQFTDSDLIKIIDDLRSKKMIKPDKVLKETGLGRVSALLYFSHKDIWDWYNNFNQIFKTKQNSNLVLAWALGDIDTKRMPFIPKQLIDDELLLRQMLYSEGITKSQVDAVGNILGIYHSLEGTEPSNMYLSAITRTVAMEMDRSITALKMIDDFYTRWDYNWDDLHTSTLYGVSKELFQLVSIPGVGKSRAEKLYKNGFKSIQDIANSSVASLKRIVGESVAKSIKEYCNEKSPTKIEKEPETKIISNEGKRYVRRRKNVD